MQDSKIEKKVSSRGSVICIEDGGVVTAWQYTKT